MALVTTNSRLRKLIMLKATQICVEEDVVSSNDPENTGKPALPQSSWKSCVWDTFDKSPEERRFLFKLDVALLTFATLGYFVKTLDQNNINSAFVSGMKEDLGLYKNELNYMQACWTVGYALGEIPSNLLLTRIRPRYWLPAMEVCTAAALPALDICLMIAFV
ncbi:Putative Pantothenate transporter [Aspergillus calidoustus]|uniref:Putative Pantothenate transporter n=1 Tax=Aspergillus calidoustus TaxID=454130 RepID=A0A0U5HHC3_ASPCI|nr:Putative Pantothenate transporter [Aspergillus calidoustus]